VGGLFAALVGKQVFGGIGQNLFNPAMLARAVLLISFPLEMTQWVAPHPFGTADAPSLLHGLAITFGDSADLDAVSGASLLGHLKTELARGHGLSASLAGPFDGYGAAIGRIRGSLAETSALLLGLGGLFLLARRITGWHTPFAMLGSVAVLSALFHAIDPERFADPLIHLLSGGLVLGALFIATDPVGAPATRRGQLLFGAGCGALTWVIRTFGGYPEGVAFAVLLMNAATPLIDHYVKPRIYGRRRDGAPLPLRTPTEE
jgi:electron transport complex protein RnfD